MKTTLLENLTMNFPLTKENANKLIKEYGNLAYVVAFALYKAGFYFPLLNDMYMNEALNVNLAFKKAVDEVKEAKAELEKVNNKLTEKCTNEELNSLLLYLMVGSREPHKRMAKCGISIIDNNGRFKSNALINMINILNIVKA